MKKYLYLFAFSAVLTACSLKEDRISVTDPENYFRNYTECQSVVNGCYIPLNTIHNATFFVVSECVSDLMYLSGSNINDAHLDISPATPRFGDIAWTQGYLGVSRCNYTIWGIEHAPEGAISDAQRVELLCEVKALRGFYYLFLTNMFGDVPFYFDAVLTMEDQDRIGRFGRMPAKDTRDAVIADLQAIAPLAPQTRTSDNKDARAGAALAYLMIAKCAMWNAAEDPSYWDTALSALAALEAIYGDFAQYDYQTNVYFRNKNTPESILEVQHIYKAGGLAYTSNLAVRTIPRLTVVDGKPYYDGVLIEELGIYSQTGASARPNEAFVQTQQRNGPDRRAEVNMAWGYGGKDFTNARPLRPYLGPKFWCPNMQSSQDGNNYKLYRYADAMLMKAECLCGKHDYEGALGYLNKTRLRAGLNEYTDTTPETLIEEIRTERGRELFGEFQRKFDLVRWGIFYETVKAKTSYASVRNNILPCHRYYPIPDTEVAKSKGALDNKEYEQYGY